MTAKKEIVEQKKNELNDSERFQEYIIREFGKQIGNAGLSDYQNRLVQGYFIGIGSVLKAAEEKRIAKNENNSDHKFDNELEITWNKVDLKQLAVDLVNYSRIGLDMSVKNHLSAIPFKNKKKDGYVIGFIPGYDGIKYVAMKYATDKPRNVTTELIYSTDKFSVIKKSSDSAGDRYLFEVPNPLSRGDIIGGFGYIEYDDHTKNKLYVMSLDDIMKRKPTRASAEFWGGTVTRYEKGKKVEEENAGWFAEMCEKTLKRYVYSKIEIDPEKIDENFNRMKESNLRCYEMEAAAMIEEKENSQPLQIEQSLPESEIVEPVNEDWQKEQV